MRNAVCAALGVVLCFAGARAQSADGVQRLLDRLNALEKSNQSMVEELKSLRAEVAALRGSVAPAPASAEAIPDVPLDERLAVDERRIEEQAQAKVESAQRFPLRLSGMLLVNAFANGKQGYGADNPTFAGRTATVSASGATLTQSFFGLEFNGPQTFGGGKIHGSVYFDFYNRSDETWTANLNIRTARVDVDWRTRSVMVGQDKPLISPRDPTSMARVAISPLSDSGNLWYWLPQARFEQRVRLGENGGLRLQAAVIETNESASAYAGRLGDANPYAPVRPGVEGRVEFWKAWSDTGRIEIAPGIHASNSHVGGLSLPSNVYSADWLLRPVRRVEFTGTAFTGNNVAALGSGLYGFGTRADGSAFAVRSHGGWAQVKLLATERLTFNAFGGFQTGRRADLGLTALSSNRSYAGNMMFRLAPNVMLAFEALRVRTTYLDAGTRQNSHYDLALGYLF